MAKKTLREISYEYAQNRGGGLPLTAEELCNCVVLWVQQFIEEQFEPTTELVAALKNNVFDSIFTNEPLEKVVVGDKIIISLEAVALLDLFTGSDTVVVDLDESGAKIEVHLDGEIVAKLDRAILTPLANPSVDSVPVVGQNGAVRYEPYDHATTLYVHRLVNPTASGNNTLTIVMSRSDVLNASALSEVEYRYLEARIGYNTTDLEGNEVVGLRYVPKISNSPAYFHVFYYDWDTEQHAKLSFIITENMQYSVFKL